MARASVRVPAMALLLVPLLVRAEGKCSDDPYYWKAKGLLIDTWIVPYPADAAEPVDDVPAADVNLLADLDKLGAVPPGFPAEHGNQSEYPYPPQPTTAEFPNAKSPLKTLDEVKRYLGGFNMVVEPEAAPYFQDYFGKKNAWMYARVVRHPAVPNNGTGFRFCTCILQRAVAIWDPPAKSGQRGTERLWLKTRFRSLRDSKNFVNFAPARPLKFTFPRAGIWFPLAFNTIIPEPAVPAFLLLDVLTRTRLNLTDPDVASALARNQLSAEQVDPTIRYDGVDWQVTRIYKKYQRGDPAEDLELPIK